MYASPAMLILNMYNVATFRYYLAESRGGLLEQASGATARPGLRSSLHRARRMHNSRGAADADSDLEDSAK